MSRHNYEDDLAYGDNYPHQNRAAEGDTDRNIVGDTFRKFKSMYQQSSYGQSSHHPQNYGYGPAPGSATSPPYDHGSQSQSYQQQSQPSHGQPGPQQNPDLVSKLFSGLQSTVQSIGSDVAGLLGTQYPSTQYGRPDQAATCAQGQSQTRFGSFASEKAGNDVKWYVDGAGYFHAVSKALEGATESIWILDWWLSPELYLRRPPSKNEQYRLDRMLQRAAERGVRVNIIVYKEVTQALTRKYISPLAPKHILGLLPSSTNAFTRALVHLGVKATTMSMEYSEKEYPLIDPVITVSSSHTKHALETLHPNIAVFRHPDHLPDARTAESSLISSLQGLRLDAAGASKLGTDALKALYGLNPQDATVLYWAHHEKLLLVDSKIAFMGGLDLCFGRWDLNQHPIADAHGGDLKDIVWPGQDYNNGRILDFQDVAQPFQNKLDRTQNSRMGWSDISICLQGQAVKDLRYHFVNRWNFVFSEKYNRGDPRYTPLSMSGRPVSSHIQAQQHGQYQQQNLQPPPVGYAGSAPQFAPQTGIQVAQWQPGIYPQTPQPTLQPYGHSIPQFPPPPGSQVASQPSWQSTSRPHTPEPSVPSYANTEPQFPSPSGNQSIYQPAWQGTSHSQVPESHTQQYPQQTPSPSASYQPYRPSSSHSGSQHGPYYPPPPPGPAPTSSQQPYGQTQTAQSDATAYDPSASQPPANYSELPTQDYERDTYPHGQNYPPPPPEVPRGFDSQSEDQFQQGSERGIGSRVDKYRHEGRQLGNELGSFGSMLGSELQNRVQKVQGSLIGGNDQYGRPLSQPRGAMSCQVVRSCTKWSNGTSTEHSIQEAYIETIRAAQHFIYIENQFFITATGDRQHPVYNQIGKALVDRILQAARAGEHFKVMVNIPSIPGFAGDLQDESALGTRAIMDFQYKSINRGGHSIMELIAKEGYNPMDYIRFYNLRNYDRINVGRAMKEAENQSGVKYEDARREHDDYVGAGYGAQGEQTGVNSSNPGRQYQQYQVAAQHVNLQQKDRWDTVSECYMQGGTDIRSVPWDGPPDAEIDAFVSEELYIHTKVLIADDRVVICGSANLNDRSQLGTHDSEIALVITDSTLVRSSMAGLPWQASRFAASLRRQLFRKHLGLILPQNPEKPDANFELVGVPNAYDWGSPEDNIVSDPLSDTFQSLWNSRARTNTEVFRKVFHAVPDDTIHSWSAYREFYEYYFHKADSEAQGKDGNSRPAKYEWGHVVRDEFPGGAHEVKDWLSRVKGTIVEMPLTFLQNEEIAKQGLSLNPVTETIYT